MVVTRVLIDQCKVGVYKGKYMPPGFRCGTHGETGFVKVDADVWMCVKCKDNEEILRLEAEARQDSTAFRTWADEVAEIQARRKGAIVHCASR